MTERFDVETEDVPAKSAGLSASEVAGDGSARAIGLVLASQHPLTLCGLSQVLEREPECTVLAVCTHAAAVVDTVRRHQPDIVVLDLQRQDALRVLRHLQRDRVLVRVMIFASTADEAAMVEVTQPAGHGIVPRDVSPEGFLAMVRAMRRVDVLIDPGTDSDPRIISRPMTIGLRRHAPRQLTRREAEIAQLAVRGISTKDIAARLDVKQGTVKIHLHSIYEKLNVGGRLGLILYARRHRLL